MKRKSALPELLSPAGSIEALYAAVEAGADAVYLGLSEGESNARVGAKNFSREELSFAIPYAHGHGVKVYLTLNTLAYDGEMNALVDLARFAADAGVDAFIVADMGLSRLLAQAVPSVALHASTQTFTHSTKTADALYRSGFSRVVLARESSAKDIKSVTERSLAETEVFLHGALCVSHSGQCLFSSMVGGRSGNRGACAQPCRLPYNGTYPLSLKDLCLAAHIPALIDMGVASLKIEGRMKSPSYVYTVTSIYRRLLDEGRAATKAELRALEDAFSRSGFTDSYFTEQKHNAMTGVRTERDKQASRASEEKKFSPLPISVTASAVLKEGESAQLTLTAHPKGHAPISVTATGAAPTVATNAPLTDDGVRQRLSKMGGTPFCISSLSLLLDEGLFLPVGAQNALRRKATEMLLESLCALRAPNALFPEKINESSVVALQAPKTAVFHRARAYLETDTSFFDIVFLPLEECSFLKEHMPNGILVPPVVFDSEEEAVKEMLADAKKKGAKYALVGSLGGILLAKEAGLCPVGDFRLNITNRESAALYRSLGVSYFILSPELSPAKGAHIGGGYTVYGRIPLMLTERCFVKDVFGCDACGHTALTDRRGARFPVLPAFGHRALVFNSLPTYLGDQKEVLRTLAPLGAHFIFSTESPKEINGIIAAYQANSSLGKEVRRAYK